MFAQIFQRQFRSNQLGLLFIFTNPDVTSIRVVYFDVHPNNLKGRTVSMTSEFPAEIELVRNIDKNNRSFFIQKHNINIITRVARQAVWFHRAISVDSLEVRA